MVDRPVRVRSHTQRRPKPTEGVKFGYRGYLPWEAKKIVIREFDSLQSAKQSAEHEDYQAADGFEYFSYNPETSEEFDHFTRGGRRKAD